MESLQPGDIVKYSRPVDETESAARFVLLENNGDRVTIRLVCDLPIPPVECVAASEVNLAR